MSLPEPVKKPRGASRKARIAARRLRAEEMALAGYNEFEIARELKVSQPTISKDLTFVKQEWADRRVELHDTRVAIDIARAEAAIRAIWDRVLAGHNLSIDRLVSLITYRAKTLGVPDKTSGTDLSAELAALLTQAALEAAKEHDTDA